MYYLTKYVSPVGVMTLACRGGSLVGLWLEGQKYYGAGLAEPAAEKNDMPVFAAARDWLDRYFAGERPSAPEFPLAPAGGAFRQTVWDILRGIPYGEVVSYGGVAKKAAERLNRKSMSSQAIGGAVGHNPICVIIPCHRVVGADGSLTGYAGGIRTKVKLLELEGADMTRLFVPKRGTAL